MQLGAWAEPIELPEGPDASSLDGARRLADKINAVWAAKGINANARPVLMPFSPRMREAYYVVRSDLVDARTSRAPNPVVNQ